MQRTYFNQESQQPRYTYVRSPVYDRAFQILKYQNGLEQDPVAVGDYTVLDQEEDLGLAEKKVMNLVTLLNGKKKLIQLGHETNSRILYHIVSEQDEENKANVVFYKLGQEGVSVENALFRIERDENVWN